MRRRNPEDPVHESAAHSSYERAKSAFDRGQFIDAVQHSAIAMREAAYVGARDLLSDARALLRESKHELNGLISIAEGRPERRQNPSRSSRKSKIVDITEEALMAGFLEDPEVSLAEVLEEESATYADRALDSLVPGKYTQQRIFRRVAEHMLQNAEAAGNEDSRNSPALSISLKIKPQEVMDAVALYIAEKEGLDFKQVSAFLSGKTDTIWD